VQLSLIYSASDSGLILATEGSDEAACAAALKEYDSDLRLVPQDSDAFGQRVYKVFRYAGSEQPAQFVCGWWDDMGKPYGGLSVTGLLEMVKRLDRNTRSYYVDPDVRNAELTEKRRREAHAQLDEIADEFRGKIDGTKSSPLPRGRDLYLARNRVRARTKDKDLWPS
jgi:hypothetical protein